MLLNVTFETYDQFPMKCAKFHSANVVFNTLLKFSTMARTFNLRNAVLVRLFNLT